MKVQAKCVFPAWDNPFLYQPGRGPLPDGLYEIEHDGPLAKMKDARGKWVFEFDRQGMEPGLTSDGTFVCKKCGEKFDTVSELGAHARREKHTRYDGEAVNAGELQPNPDSQSSAG